MDAWIFIVILGGLVIGLAAYLRNESKQFKTKGKRSNMTQNAILAVIAVSVFFSMVLIPTTVNPVTQKSALIFAIILIAAGIVFFGHFSNAKDISEKRVGKHEITKATVLRAYGLDGRGFKLALVGGTIGFIAMFVTSTVLSGVLGSIASLMAVVPSLDLTGLSVASGDVLDILLIVLNATSEDFLRAGIIVGFELMIAQRALRLDPRIPSVDHALGKVPGQAFSFKKADVPMSLIMGLVSVLIGFFFGTWHVGVTTDVAAISIISANGIILYYVQRAVGFPGTAVAHFLFNFVIKKVLFVAAAGVPVLLAMI